METQESEGNPSMKGTRNCMQPFQWANSRTPRMKFDILAIGELALNSYTHTHIHTTSRNHTYCMYIHTHTLQDTTCFAVYHSIRQQNSVRKELTAALLSTHECV